MKQKKKLKMWQAAMIALVVSIAFGLGLSYLGGSDVGWINFIMRACSFVGNVYLRLLKLLSIPLIFACIFDSVVKLQDLKKLRKLGVRAIALFLITSAIAIIFGIIITNILQPGKGFTMEEFQAASYEAAEVDVFDSLLTMVPQNIFEALSKGEAMQVIIFCIIAGIAAIALAGKAKAFEDVVESFEGLMFKVTDIVLKFTPYGVFGLMTNTMAKYGGKIVGRLLTFIACDWLAAIMMFLTVYMFELAVICKINPFKFLARFKECVLIAISTLVSIAPMPLAMRILKEEIGVPEDKVDFVLPFGATTNMNGTVVYFGVITMFTCQLMGITFTPLQYILLVIQGVLMAVSCATIPSLALVLSATLLASLGLPLNAIGLVMGIHHIVNMAHTPTNCTGCYVAATTLAALDGTLDREKADKLK